MSSRLRNRSFMLVLALGLGPLFGCNVLFNTDVRQKSQPLGQDGDGDGIADEIEIANGTDPGRDDASEDLDGDGLSNEWEILLGYDPRVPRSATADGNPSEQSDCEKDFDGDGLGNCYEISAGLDPKDPNDAPAAGGSATGGEATGGETAGGETAGGATAGGATTGGATTGGATTGDVDDGVGPTGGSLAFASATATTITLSHVVPTDDDYESVVLRRSAAGCAAIAATDGAGVAMTTTATSITDTGLLMSTAYCYKIFWTDSFGNVSTAVVDNATTISAPICSRSTSRNVWYVDGNASYGFSSAIKR